MISVDTNVLIYAHRSGVPEHSAARRVLQAAADDPRGWGISVTSVSEFWSIVTHPKAQGRPSKPAQAASFLRALTDSGGMQIWLPGRGFADRLTRLACDLEVCGVRIFDLQIALTAIDNGATELWTHDSGFIRVPGLRFTDPLRKQLHSPG
jgi:toxin-antitoxin system PIN domain toxin